jgi:hypothetical protein
MMGLANFVHNAAPWIFGFLCCGWPVIVNIGWRNLPKLFGWISSKVPDEDE